VYIHIQSIYDSRALCLTFAAFLISISWCTQSVGLLGRRISPSQGRYLHTGQHRHRLNAHTDIHAHRTHDPSFGRAKTVHATVIGSIYTRMYMKWWTFLNSTKIGTWWQSILIWDATDKLYLHKIRCFLFVIHIMIKEIKLLCSIPSSERNVPVVEPEGSSPVPQIMAVPPTHIVTNYIRKDHCNITISS
jgi:hypothetical protein